MTGTPITTEKEQLLKQREELLSDIALLKETLRGEVDVDLEEGDPDVIEREKSAALLAALEARLASVEDALRAMERGTYGICERCGKPIPPERLEVKPDATLCVTCQAEVERLQKRGLLQQMQQQRPFWGLEMEPELEEEEE
ncbi:MAG: TraR/DksA C4-type zinc finger protein [Anaerolineae bacterium]|nr:TraR/DksA C4-type zinc finger protein [Caldilineales bacterium]MCX7853399.1 TraR/DksA C4-type zinc finger protein [Caldilineales bacterium]MDW8267836.1 TraR/DksA C4-type zinc finger protein [Anaerolineae bacterium]